MILQDMQLATLVEAKTRSPNNADARNLPTHDKWQYRHKFSAMRPTAIFLPLGQCTGQKNAAMPGGA